MIFPGNRNAVFLHRLQQCRLGSRAGPVDFIGHQQLTEDRASDEAKGTAAFFRFFQHFRAKYISGHQVRGELNAPGIETEDPGNGFNQPCFTKTGNTNQQQVPTSKQGNQGFFNGIMLAKNTLADTIAGGGHITAQLIYPVDQLLGIKRFCLYGFFCPRTQFVGLRSLSPGEVTYMVTL